MLNKKKLLLLEAQLPVPVCSEGYLSFSLTLITCQVVLLPEFRQGTVALLIGY